MNIKNQNILPNGNDPDTGAPVRFKVADHLGSGFGGGSPQPPTPLPLFTCKNQVVNGSFDGWVNKQIVNSISRLTVGVIPPDFWVFSPYELSARIVEDAGCKDNYTPLNRDQLVDTAASFYKAQLSQLLRNLKPSTKYYLTFWYKSAGIFNELITSGAAPDLNLVLPSSASWVQYKTNFTTDNIGSDVNVLFIGEPTAGDILVIDNVIVNEGTQEEFYPNPGDHHLRATTFIKNHEETNGQTDLIQDTYEIADVRTELGSVEMIMPLGNTVCTLDVALKVPFTYKFMTAIATVQWYSNITNHFPVIVSIEKTGLGTFTIHLNWGQIVLGDIPVQIDFVVSGV